jgi:hypothetical protein
MEILLDIEPLSYGISVKIARQSFYIKVNKFKVKLFITHIISLNPLHYAKS